MSANTTTAVVAHHLRSAAASFSNSVKSRLGALAGSSEKDSSQQPARNQLQTATLHQQQQQQQQHERDHHAPTTANIMDVSQEVELGHSTAPRHEHYPSMQTPWKKLDRRLMDYAATMPISANYVAPRQPIVLCHGLFGFDKMGPDAIPSLQIHYWSGIQKALTKLGAKVIVARVPRTGAIKQRAHELHSMLSSSMSGMRVNLLAHSMGGLDARYLISHIPDKNYQVGSLTTLSTPHQGSPFMDWCRDNIGVGCNQSAEAAAMQEVIAKNLMAVGQSRRSPLLDKDQKQSYHQTTPNQATGFDHRPQANAISPLLNRLIPLLDTPAYSNLTTNYLTEVFNPNTPDSPDVAYYSYGASARKIPLWAPLGFPWEVIKAKEGDNDGLVSLTSAKWGTYVKTVECDHWDLNNRWRLKIGHGQEEFDAVELYLSVATRMFHDGF